MRYGYDLDFCPDWYLAAWEQGNYYMRYLYYIIYYIYYQRNSQEIIGYILYCIYYQLSIYLKFENERQKIGVKFS